VVETPDSVFVSDLDNSRDVKDIVSTLKVQGRKEFKIHRTIHHPWGNATLLEEQTEFSVQRVVVYAGGSYRSIAREKTTHHLTVVSGRAKAYLRSQSQVLKRGASISVCDGTTVEIENTDDSCLVLIEVETKMDATSKQTRRCSR
jgi:mannose-6-phosphate isomerase-like protein (cupin superfamily)